jgi:hypothetical protein
VTFEQLAPYARASVRSRRRTFLGLGLVLLALGGLCLAILVGVSVSGAARPEDGVVPIGVIVFVVAGLPGLWLVSRGMRRDATHPLVSAIEIDRGRIRNVGFSYREVIGGYAKVAVVTLTDGSWYSFDVPTEHAPADAARPARRATRLGSARPEQGARSFSGTFVASGAAASGVVGRGLLEVGADGLTFVATRPREALAMVVGVVAGALAGALVVGVSIDHSEWIDDLRFPAVMAIAAAYGTWAGARWLVRRGLAPAAMRRTVPWGLVASVRAVRGALEIHTTAPELPGLSTFHTDFPDAVARACDEARRAQPTPS